MLNHMIFEGDPTLLSIVEVAALVILAAVGVWLLWRTPAWPRMARIVCVALALAGVVFLSRQVLAL